MILFSFLSYLSLFIIRSDADIAKSLKLVHVLFRHGDRTPVRTFPTDPYPEEYWPNGLGQLTKEGIMQQFELGKFLRQRYDGFISRDYIRRQIYVRSTDKDRALLSAQSSLTAMYNLTKINGITLMPIPVHTVEIDKDYLLYPHYDCPRYKQLWKESIKSMELKPYQMLYDYVAPNAGFKQGKIDVQWLWHLAGIFMVHVHNNLTLPSWVTSDIYNTLLFLKDKEFQMKGHLPEMIRLTGGNLLKKILNDTEALFKDELDDQMRMFLYSAHDTTVSVFLRALKNFNGEMPPYSACVLIEAHDTGKGEPFIQIHFRNDTAQPPYLLTLEGCTRNCPISKFRQLLQPILPIDIVAECRIKINPAAPAVGFTVVGLFLLLLLTVCPCLSFKNWTRYLITDS